MINAKSASNKVKFIIIKLVNVKVFVVYMLNIIFLILDAIVKINSMFCLMAKQNTVDNVTVT